MRCADLRTQRHILAVGVLTHALDDELLRHQLRDPRSQLQLNQIEHEIERCGAAGAGVPVPVDGEQLVANAHSRKLLAQGGEILPMNRGAKIVEQAGPRKGIAPGAQAAQRYPAVRKAPEAGKKRRGDCVPDVDAAAHEKDVDRPQFIQDTGGRQTEAAAGIGGPPVEADDGPLVDVSADQAIRHSQRFDGVRDGDQGIMRQRQKGISALSQNYRRIHRDLRFETEPKLDYATSRTANAQIRQNSVASRQAPALGPGLVRPPSARSGAFQHGVVAISLMFGLWLVTLPGAFALGEASVKTHARVVVIGGGVVGVSTLYHLALKGWSDVVLLERAELTAGSTWHAAGLLPLFNMSYTVGQLHKYSVDL